MEGKKLFKVDSKGKTRVWWMEWNEESYWTHSGQVDGKITVSKPKFPKAKNIGKANETTVEQQVLLEVGAQYEKQSYQGKYFGSEDAAKNDAPKFFAPMLAGKYDPEKQSFPVKSQPKLDGIRCVTSKDGMFTRQGKDIVSCPHIMEDLKEFFGLYPDVILDGELYNHTLKADFEKIVSLVRKTKPTEEDIQEAAGLVEYHVYDWVSPLSFEDRDGHRLKQFSKLFSSRIVPVVTDHAETREEVDDLMAKYLEEGYEGQMVRDPSWAYDEGKRSKGLMKNKTFDDAEFEIVELTEGVGNWSGYVKSVVIALPDGTTQNSGMRGTQEMAKELLENKDSYIGTQVTVRYQGKTSDGKLRFPVITQFWKGKRDV